MSVFFEVVFSFLLLEKVARNRCNCGAEPIYFHYLTSNLQPVYLITRFLLIGRQVLLIKKARSERFPSWDSLSEQSPAADPSLVVHF
jgi:hypothetical protein